MIKNSKQILNQDYIAIIAVENQQEADNVTIKTSGGSSATLATDRGEVTVIAKNSKLETNDSGSPVIYSTGDISIENTEGTANGSQMVVIEGKN